MKVILISSDNTSDLYACQKENEIKCNPNLSSSFRLEPRKNIVFSTQNATTQVVPYLQVHPSKQDSLVKFHYFQLAFLENCLYKKQKKSKKDQRNFCSNTFLKVFANSVSAHFIKI